MSGHNSAVFNHSCLRVPRNPANKKPVPVYEQKYLNHLENQVRKLSLDSNDSDLKPKHSKCFGSDSLNSFIDFFDSIPNYEDVNHLSNRDFYRKLEVLKEKQRSYYDFVDCENRDGRWVENCKKLSEGHKGYASPPPKPKSSLKPFCASSALNKSSKHEEYDILMFSDKEATSKPPSRRSVRIESPSEKISLENTPDLEYFRSKSRANISSASSKGKLSSCNDTAWDDLNVEELKFDSQRATPLVTRSAPSSPNKNKQNVGWKDTITIPKPFQMTVRDEENQIIDEILITSTKPKDEKHDMFKAHPVPVESKIPLFDKIMADQERRRQKVRKKSKAALRAQMRPFSFTRKEEEMENLTRRMSRSTPSLFLDDCPMTIKQFKAKPVPRNLFSNYIYKKMHEDEFYRSLQKKIRAEEMLRAASLPPSMAKRERCKIKTAICARALGGAHYDEDFSKKPNRKKVANCQQSNIEEFMKEYLCYSPTTFKKSKKKRLQIKSSSSTTSRTNTESNRLNSALSLDCLNRSNLAAILRTQTARKRLAMDMCKKLDDAKWMEEARWKEKVMRKKPVWEVLTYSHEEDLAMRLQMRRDEERLRNEEHRHRMNNMLGRVNQQPTLFERQSQNQKYQSDIKAYKYMERDSVSPKFSFSDCSEKRYLIDMKDEAIQAGFDVNGIGDEREKYEYDDQEKDDI